MEYQSLYRRFRPQDFDALVGQEHIKTTLSNALDLGRIAHAYLFTGPRGTGKTTTARIVAKALNCEQGPTSHPCNHCPNCLSANAGSSMDIFEIDAASNRGIDEIRQLREKVAFAPVNGRYKIYIIDEVHMMTNDAFNALLKTLEEPPKHVVFILATTEPQKIPATIHSRCQRFDFRRVTVPAIVSHLQGVAAECGIETEENALKLIAVQAEGGLRDALSLLEQCAVAGKSVTTVSVQEVLGMVGREAMRKLCASIGKRDLPAALCSLEEFSATGKDVKQILTELSGYLRAILLYLAAPSYEEIYLTDAREELALLAEDFDEQRIIFAQQRIQTALEDMRWAVRDKLAAELCLVDLCLPEQASVKELTERVAALEKLLSKEGVSRQMSVQAAPVTAGRSVPERPLRAAAVEKEKPLPRQERAGDISSGEPLAPMHGAPTDTKKNKLPETTVDDSGGAQEPSTAVTGNLSALSAADLWQRTLDKIKAEKKMSLYACAAGGAPLSFDGKTLTVYFKVAYSCERMQKNDYKEKIEEVLTAVAAGTVLLVCTVNNDASVKPQADAEAATDEEEDLIPAVQKALEIFGGSIEK